MSLSQSYLIVCINWYKNKFNPWCSCFYFHHRPITTLYCFRFWINSSTCVSIEKCRQAFSIQGTGTYLFFLPLATSGLGVWEATTAAAVPFGCCCWHLQLWLIGDNICLGVAGQSFGLQLTTPSTPHQGDINLQKIVAGRLCPGVLGVITSANSSFPRIVVTKVIFQLAG